MRNKRVIKVGSLKMGGNNPVVIKGMIKSSIDNLRKVFQEAKRLENAGCQILRIAIEKEASLGVVPKLKNKISIPIEADVHFDYRLALGSIGKGADMIRLNPANIYKPKQVSQIVRKAKEFNVSIRVGLNSGGVKKKMSQEKLAYYLLDKTERYLKLIGKDDFHNLAISAKTHSLESTLLVNRLLDSKFRLPVNIGVTASGPYYEGLVKSSVALGILLSEGIGDGIRLSLNTDSEDEIRAAKVILQSLGLRRFFPEIISCPTCSRCKVDLKQKVEKFKEVLYKRADSFYNKNRTIALMGCPVNGPGEASTADIGIAFGRGYGIFFKKGKRLKRIKEGSYIEALINNLTK